MWRIIGEWLEPLVSSSNNNIHTLSYHLLPETYIQNASIYITKTRSFYQHNSTVGSNILSFVMTDDESIDINSELDFLMAETLLNKELK